MVLTLCLNTGDPWEHLNTAWGSISRRAASAWKSLPFPVLSTPLLLVYWLKVCPQGIYCQWAHCSLHLMWSTIFCIVLNDLVLVGWAGWKWLHNHNWFHIQCSYWIIWIVHWVLLQTYNKLRCIGTWIQWVLHIVYSVTSRILYSIIIICVKRNF